MIRPRPIRVALFSGNYNYVRDGANQSLNRLVGYLLKEGVSVRVYSPTTSTPAFEPVGDLVPVASVPIPGRAEYRLPVRLGAAASADLAAFAPDIVHISSPDPVALSALRWAERRGLPAVATVHTRFETYLQYYRLGALAPLLRAYLRHVYRRCFKLLAPTQGIAEELRDQEMNDNVGIWSRGIDRTLFNEGRRDLAWRRSLGFADDDVVVLFLGRLVLEKGIAVFAEAIRGARQKGAAVKVLVVGDGPERERFAADLGADAVFTGALSGEALARAVASADIFFNPSRTETFGNVTLEAMSAGLPVVAALATGAIELVRDRVSGTLCRPDRPGDYAEAILRYAADPALRRSHGQAGIEDAKSRDWDRINRAVIEAYQDAIAARADAKRA